MNSFSRLFLSHQSFSAQRDTCGSEGGSAQNNLLRRRFCLPDNKIDDLQHFFSIFKEYAQLVFSTVVMLSDEDVSPPKHSCFIGQREDVIRANRVVTSVNGRDVLVLHHQGELHALDAHCYHAGGPLQHGDIEEVAGRVCIVCPWHKYKISVRDGEGLYRAVDPSIKPLKPNWCSKGAKQRVHMVTEVRGRVYVTLNTSSEHLESDQYQTPKFRDTLQKNRK